MASNRGFRLLQMQYVATTKRNRLSQGWFCATTSRPGQPFHQPRVPHMQIRFASNNNDGWYDWYKRLRVGPKASDKELRNAYRKQAMIEHPDHDKRPGAKARFQNLQETYENLCDELKRKQHDQERLERQKASAAETARMMSSQPSVADSLWAKWKAEEESLRAADESRKREVRNKTRPAPSHSSFHERQAKHARPQDTKGPGVDAEKPKNTSTGNFKEAPPKEQQRQEQPEETEESRRMNQKMEEAALAKKRAAIAKKRAAAAQKKIKDDADKKKAEENNRLQERVITIRKLRPKTKLADVFDPLVELAPGPVFCAKRWPNNMVEIEFCADAAARTVLALAEKYRLFIKGNCVTNVQLTRSENDLPVIGRKSRVLELRKMGAGDMAAKNESVPAFLTKFGLQVERIVKQPSTEWNSVTVRFASWTDAERAIRLLAKYLPHINVDYSPDPCGMKDSGANSTASDTVRLFVPENTEQKSDKKSDLAGFLLGMLLVVLMMRWLSPPSKRDSAEIKASQERRLQASGHKEKMIRSGY